MTKSAQTIGTTIHDETVTIERRAGKYRVCFFGEAMGERFATEADALAYALRMVPAHRRAA